MPYMKNGKRDYQAEKAWDHRHDHGQRIKDRDERNKARAMLMKEGKVHKWDGYQVDHIKALTDGGKTIQSNLRAVPDKVNLEKEAHRKQRVARKK